MVETIINIRKSAPTCSRIGARAVAEEIAAEMNMEVDKIRHIQKFSRNGITRNFRGDSDDDSVLGDFIEDTEKLCQIRLHPENCSKNHVAEVLRELTPRRSKRFSNSFWAGRWVTHTLEEVGKELE